MNDKIGSNEQINFSQITSSFRGTALMKNGNAQKNPLIDNLSEFPKNEFALHPSTNRTHPHKKS
jgi:hypothetical protein